MGCRQFQTHAFIDEAIFRFQNFSQTRSVTHVTDKALDMGMRSCGSSGRPRRRRTVSGMGSNRVSRIFLSHSSQDNFEAFALKNWLASEGWGDVFLDLDPERGIAAGQRWERALNAAANHCEAVIFLVSGNWLGSTWCKKEYYLARGLNKKLFAALIDPADSIESLPEELKGVWQVVDLVGGQDLRLFVTQLPSSHEERHVAYSQSGLLRLKRGLEKAGLDPKFFAWPPENEPDRAPYRGLKPHEAADAGVFFGRDAPIVEAIDRLRGLRAGAPPRLMAILGASGAGKSSFLRAGLLPRLKRDDTQFIPLPVVRPERAALMGESGFVSALATILPAHAPADLREATQAGAGALRPLLTEIVQAAMAQRIAGDETERPPAFVVAIDQAEELFRAEGREESAALLALLADLVADDPAVIVIFTIRSDSYDALQNAKALEGLRQIAFSLSPMPRGAYQEVIEGPARRVEEAGGKLTIEPALTQRLLVDVEKGAGDALPLLAFTLEQLYRGYRPTGALRLIHYEKSGGLKGAIDAAVERALARADADPRIPGDREARLALLRRGLIPWLAGIDPDSKTPRRNIARRSDIPPEAAPLIDLLAEERLLSRDTRVTHDPKTGEETQEKTIEPTHEALLRQWGLLAGWLAEDLGRLTTLEGVKRAARDWDANARVDSWLAHQGERLADAQALDSRPDIAARLDPTDRTYLASCRAREETARAEAEQRRREREEEQARKLADARKIAFRTGVGAVAALLFAIMAGALAYYGVSEKTLADQKAAEAVREKNAADAAANEATAQKALADQQTEEALTQKNKADAATKDALAQRARADSAAAEAIRNESVALTALAATEATRHPVNAAKLALAAWPRDSSDTAPKLDETLDLLGQVVPQLRERVRIPSGGTVASFSPDGTRIVTAPDHATARIWDAADGHEIATLKGHDGDVTFAAFSPDGKHVVTTSKDNTARIWDAATGDEIAKLKGHDDVVTSATFSRDGGRLVTASDDNSARIWDAATGAPITILKGHGDEVTSAAFSPDGGRVVTASGDMTARIWDAADGRAIATLKGHGGPVASAAFGPNGAQVVTASADMTARIWDAADGHKIVTLKGHSGPLVSAAFSPDGGQVITASDDRTARIWDAADGHEIATLKGHDGPVTSAAFSFDGKWAVTASGDNTARIWDAATGREIARLKGHDGMVFSAAFNNDATRVATVSNDDSTTRVWDASLGRSIATLEGHDATVSSAAFSPDGTHVVTASDDKTARLWDAATGRAVGTLVGHDGPVRSAAFNDDGTRVVTASDDKTARLWDAAAGRAVGTLVGHDGSVRSAAFNHAGTRIVTASEDNTARLWDAAAGRPVATLVGHDGQVWSAAFSPDGTRVVTASADKTARVWDATTGLMIATLKGHSEKVASAAFSADGKRVVTASYDNTARIWDVATERAIAMLRHKSPVTSAAFSPDGARVVTASTDGTARIWDVVSGREIATLNGHDGTIYSAAFSTDGNRVVTASQDKTARLWDVRSIPKGNILAVACALLPDKKLDNLVSNFPITIKPICGAGAPGPDQSAIGAAR
jgi:WD40 repeat protein